MDPSILKSLQKIEELVKNKKNIIEQIPIKSSVEPFPTVLPKPPQNNQIFPTPLISTGPTSLLKNPLLMPNYPNEGAFFLNPMNIQPPNMNLNLNIGNFNDGLMMPNQPEAIMPFYTENDNINNGKISSLSMMFILFL
jgi:hypothetical protein